jgi:hypothetical protein
MDLDPFNLVSLLEYPKGKTIVHSARNLHIQSAETTGELDSSGETF